MMKQKTILKRLSIGLAASLLSMSMVIPAFAWTNPTSLTPTDTVKIASVTTPNVVEDGKNIYFIKNTDATKVTWQRLNEVCGYTPTGTANVGGNTQDVYEQYTAGYENTPAYLNYSWYFDGTQGIWQPVTSTYARAFNLKIVPSYVNGVQKIKFYCNSILPAQATVYVKGLQLPNGQYTLAYESGCTNTSCDGGTTIDGVFPQADEMVTVQDGAATFSITHGGTFALQ